MRRLLAIFLALGLFTTGVGVAGASVRTADEAVTKDDIKVGVTYVDLTPVRARGINLDHGNYEKAFTAVINDLNAKGGVNGRKIVPVLAPVNPIGTTGGQEACVKLTEDQKVFAAVGFFLNDGPLCYLEQHATPVVGGTMTAEYIARAKAPWYTLEAGDADTAQVVEAFVKEGVFKKGKLGIVTHAQEKALLDNVVLPTLKKNKVSGTSAIIDAPASDTVAAQQQADTIVERFKADGIKTILLVGNSIVAIGRGTAKTEYRPRLVSTLQNPMNAYVNDPSNDLSVMQNAITGNVGVDFNDPALQKCYRVVEKGTGETPIVETPGPGQPSYVTSANAACRYTALFAALAAAAGKNLTTASFAKAAQKAGAIEIPGSGSIKYDPKTRAFLQPVFLYRYDPTTKTLVKDPNPVGEK